MANPLPPTGILGLPIAISLDGSEEVPLVQGGTTKRAPVSEISAFPASAGTFVTATAQPFLTQSRLLSAQLGVTTITDDGPLGNITVGIATNGIGNAQLRQGGALSVIGNASNALADVADISGTAAQILRVNNAGTALAFGSIDLSQSASVGSSILQPGNGGTGVNNSSSTLTLGGSLTTAGAFSSTFTMTGPTSVTFPTSGTLATTSGPSLPAVVQGDLLYGSAPNVLSTLPKNTSATRYLSNTGTSNDPAWAQVDLTNGVSNLLPMASGGTNANLTANNGGIVYSTATALAILAGTATARLPLLSGASTTPQWGAYTLPASVVSGGIPYFSSTSAEASSALLTANALMIGGGAGTAPSTLGSLGTTTTVLHGNAGGAPTFGAVSLTADVSGILPLANGGTNANLTASNGGIFYSTASAGAILAGTATAGQMLRSGASAAPIWSTATWPATTTINQLLYSSAANVVTGLATANGGVLNTSSGGVPSITPTPVIGVNGGTGGQITLNGATSGSAVVSVAAAAGTTTFQLPVGNGSNGQVLSTNGSGVTSWIATGGTGTVTSVVGGNQTITTTGTIQTDSGLGIQNLSLSASVATNILTVNVLDSSGATCTATSSARIQFRSATASSGAVTSNYITGALSISTFAVGATLGTSNNTAFRFWVVAFDNSAGATVLALINCANGNNIFPMDEELVASSTAMSAAATSAGVFYTPNGTTVTSKAFRILGYVEYNSTGLTTAGTYATAPNFVQLIGTGVKKPGERVQAVYLTSSSSSTTSSSTPVVSNLSTSITPRSAANFVRAAATAPVLSGTTSAIESVIRRGGATNVGGTSIGPTTGVAPQRSTLVNIAWDRPNSTSSVGYAVYFDSSDNTANVTYLTGATLSAVGMIEVEEIQG